MELKLSGILIIFTTLLLSCVYTLDSRQNPREGRLQKGRQNDNCGSLDDLAQKVNNCSRPLMDLIQGTVEKWPQNENDVTDLCKSFAGGERCIREVSRKCAKGLHKTVLSTLANSLKRVRSRECSKAKLPMLLNTMHCLENNQDVVQKTISNATSHLDLVEKQIKDLDQKTTSVCCLVSDIEQSIKQNLGPICKPETEVVVRLYRATLEDVNELICRRPKCSTNMYDGYKLNPNIGVEGVITILLKIVFSLG